MRKNCQEPLLDKLELLKSKTNKCNCLRGEVGGKYVGSKKCNILMEARLLSKAFKLIYSREYF